MPLSNEARAALLQSFDEPADVGHESAGQRRFLEATWRATQLSGHELGRVTAPCPPGRWVYLLMPNDQSSPIDDMLIVMWYYRHRPGRDIAALRIVTYAGQVCFALLGPCGWFLFGGFRTDSTEKRAAYDKFEAIFDHVAETFSLTIERIELPRHEAHTFFDALDEAWALAQRLRHPKPANPPRPRRVAR